MMRTSLQYGERQELTTAGLEREEPYPLLARRARLVCDDRVSDFVCVALAARRNRIDDFAERLERGQPAVVSCESSEGGIVELDRDCG